jgi:ABC-2 type transport system ATP-binding protein
MDEAERCHEIAYIAYGELLAQGTVDEVVANAHLATYSVTGPDLADLAADLKRRPGVDMVAPFGAALHVSGRDRARLDAATGDLRGDGRHAWTQDEPTLEDVFIDLMAQAKDNAA